MLDGPPEYIVMVFLATFQTAEYNECREKKMKMDEEQVAEAEAEAVDDLDDMARDGRECYKAQVTKWIKGALEALQSPVWWFFVHVCHKAREPVRHCFNILSMYSSWHSSKAFRSDCAASELPVVDFITKRIPQLQKEFRALVSNVCEWTQEILDKLEHMSIWSNQDTSFNVSNMQAIAVRMVMHTHSAFVRRIVIPFSRLGAVRNMLLSCFFEL